MKNNFKINQRLVLKELYLEVFLTQNATNVIYQIRYSHDMVTYDFFSVPEIKLITSRKALTQLMP